MTIVADLREKASGIPRALSQRGIEVRLQRLEVGDYLLTPRIAVERKTSVDFIQSIFDKRLFAQVGALRAAFVSPILLLEECETPKREIHPSALRGAILYVSLLNRIPILQTANPDETVEMLFAMVQLVHRNATKEFSLHAKRRSPSVGNTQRYILETIPGIGRRLAHELLCQFGSLQAVLTASSDDLMAVPGIGHNRAGKIRALMQRDYRR